MLIVMTAVAALMASTQSTPAEPAAPAPSAETAAAEGEENGNDRVVCRRERVLGSNRPQRICMTQSEWQHARDTSRETRDRSLRETPFEQGEAGGSARRSF